jgi:hypothetical protein
VVAVFFAEEGLAVEFDDEGFTEEVFCLKEVEEADGGRESFCLAVELDGHGGKRSVFSIQYSEVRSQNPDPGTWKEKIGAGEGRR